MALFRRPTDPDEAGTPEQWLAQVAAGGEMGRRAWKALVETYSAAFLKSLRSHGLTTDEARDVIQDFWLDIWDRAAAAYRAEAGSPEQWLWGVLGKKRQEALRKRQVHGERHMPYLDADADANPDKPLDSTLVAAQVALSPPTHDDRRMLGAYRDCLRKAWADLRRLDTDRGELLYRYVIEELPLDELARWRNVGRHTLETYLVEARRLFSPLAERCKDLKV